MSSNSNGARHTQISQEPTKEQLERKGERLLKIQQAATLSGCHRNTIWGYVKSGKLPAVRIGKRIVRVYESDLASLFTEYKGGEFGKYAN